MSRKLAKFVSQEALATEIDNNPLKDVAILDEQNELTERDAALAETENTVNQIDLVEGLDAVNGRWRGIAEKALDSGNVTPELREGLEAHFNLMLHHLGPVASTETFGLEGVEDNTAYLLQAVASLEGLGAKLGKIKNALYDRLSKSFHAKEDLHKQQQVYTRLGKQANDLLIRLKAKYKDPNQKLSLKTGRYTNALTQGGKLVTDLTKALSLHLKTMNYLVNDYGEAVCDNIVEVMKIYGEILKTDNDDVAVRASLKIRRVYTPSEIIPKEIVSGQSLLGNMALKPNPKSYEFKDNDIVQYIKDRGNCAAPHWTKAGPIPEAGVIEITAKELFNVIAALIKVITGLNQNYKAYVSTEDKVLAEMLRMDKLLKDSYAFGDFEIRLASIMASALTREAVNGIMPVRLALSKEIPILRGLLGFLGRA